MGKKFWGENVWGEKKPIVCINGQFLPISEARISPFDHGLLYGIGVWDVAFVYDGYTFKLDENINRFFKSAKAINLEVQWTKEELKKAVIETVRRNDLKNASLKFIVTKGVGVPLITADCGKPTLIVIAWPRQPISPPSEVEGKKAVIVSIRRIPPMCGVETSIKQLNYLNHYLMIMEAKRNGADCAIALDIQGYVVEGALQNIFVIKDQNLYTPPTASVLEGITRGTIVDIADRKGFRLIEKLLTPYDLYTADEVFLTGANNITPIIEVDGRKIGDGKPGPITIEILTEYWEMIQRWGHGIKIV